MVTSSELTEIPLGISYVPESKTISSVTTIPSVGATAEEGTQSHVVSSTTQDPSEVVQSPEQVPVLSEVNPFSASQVESLFVIVPELLPANPAASLLPKADPSQRESEIVFSFEPTKQPIFEPLELTATSE